MLQVAIYHDPGKGSNTEGQTIKQLKIQPTPDGKVIRARVLCSSAAPKDEYLKSILVTT